MGRIGRVLWAVALASACTSSEGGRSSAGGADPARDTGTDTAADTGTDTAPDTGTDTAPDTAADTGTDTASSQPTTCGPPPAFDDGLTPTAELYVAPDGDDNASGARDAPLATVAQAARRATPGTAIRVLPGEHGRAGYVEGLSGTAEAPIWIGGAPGQPRPVMRGGGEVLHLTRVRWLVVHDLELAGSEDNGVNCDDGGDYDDPEASHHVVFRRLSIHGIGSGGNQDCLKLSGLRHFRVEDSDFARCGGGGSGSGVDQVGCHHGLITGCRFADLSGNAVQVKGGSSDIEVHGCVLEDAGERGVNMGGSTGPQFFRPPLTEAGANAEARNVRVVNNVMIGANAALAFVGCVGCLAAHNTIIDPNTWLFRILQETRSTEQYTFEPARDGRFVNNLVLFDRSRLRTWVNVGGGTAPETFSFEHNLWYARDAPDQSQPNLPTPEQGGITGQDPGLDERWRVAADSPAAGAGVALSEVRGDHAGACRADPPTIGACVARP